MPIDFTKILEENVVKYGTDIDEYGPTLLANLYAEKTHFIYELLQNAEDAIARLPESTRTSKEKRRVKFFLTNEELRFSHFGQPFDENDVRGICGLAKSTKSNDFTAIGKFGIGFKSVYAFTDRPEVHCGSDHFAIESFVRPVAIQSIEMQTESTLFRLPFRFDPLSQSDSYNQIQSGLRNLGIRCLLFLQYIDCIEWEVEGLRKGSYDRNNAANGTRVTLHSSQTNAENIDAREEHWIVYSKEIRRSDEQKTMPIQVAYYVDPSNTTESTSIVPLSKSNLYVTFETEKPTGLGLLLNGPFRTTPSRDNIPREDEWNIVVIHELATLVCESLIDMRNKRLLTTSVLQCLPIQHNYQYNFPDFKSIHTTVRSFMLTEKIVPRHSGGFARANQMCLAGSSELRRLLGPHQLRDLTNSDSKIYWANGDLTQDRTPELYRYFRQELNVREIAAESLIPMLSKEYLSAQPDEWLINLYIFLGQNTRLIRRGALKNIYIVRLSTGIHAKVRDENGNLCAYLPSGRRTRLPTVRKSLLERKEAKQFLYDLGLIEPDIAAEIDSNILPAYTATSHTADKSRKDYNDDLRTFCEAISVLSTNRKNELIAKLNSTPFVRCTSVRDAIVSYQKPRDCYVRSDDIETYLSVLDEAWLVDESFVDDRSVFNELTNTLGFNRSLRFREKEFEDWKDLYDIAKAHRIRDYTKLIRAVDFSIDGLDSFLVALNLDLLKGSGHLSRVLWNLLSITLDANALDYRGPHRGYLDYFYYTAKREEYDAEWILKLRQLAWIPTKESTFRAPCEISPSDLCPDWESNKKVIEVLGFQPDTLIELAHSIGLSTGVLEMIRRYNFTEEELQCLVQARSLDVESTQVHSANDTVISTSDSTEIYMHSSGGQEGDTSVSSNNRRDGRRFHSYVYVEKNSESHLSQNTVTSRSAYDKRAIEIAINYEEIKGRIPAEMPHNHPGYDIESTDQSRLSARFIEVKAVRGDWNNTGIALSKEQFAKAQSMNSTYWIYVVDRVETENPRLFCINDPASKAEYFVFDSGWSSASSEKLEALSNT